MGAYNAICTRLYKEWIVSIFMNSSFFSYFYIFSFFTWNYQSRHLRCTRLNKSTRWHGCDVYRKLLAIDDRETHMSQAAGVSFIQHWSRRLWESNLIVAKALIRRYSDFINPLSVYVERTRHEKMEFFCLMSSILM